MKMLSQPEALAKILNSAKVLPAERVSLQQALGRCLSEDIIYDIPMPPFNKSAMDGYACRKEDLGNEMECVETIQAGKPAKKEIHKGQCAKIMTGAALPIGANMVFMKEYAELLPNRKVKCLQLNSKSNVCLKGEDVREGDMVVSKNTLVQSRHMPLLAGAGYAEVEVIRQPSVSVITTGTELVEPGEPLPEYKIRNSNASQVLAQLTSNHIHGKYLGIVEDELTEIEHTIDTAFKHSDMVILSGGVSVGDYDLIPSIIEKLGFQVVVAGSAIQPGKPMVFAQKGNQYIFGLSGNPVSSFIQFELYAKPFLYALQGYAFKQKKVMLPLAETFKRTKAGRLFFAPARISEKNEVVAIQFHGSAHINALAFADCLMEVPLGQCVIEKGEFVRITLF